MISSDNYSLTALSQQLTSLDSEASATLPTSLRRQRIRGSAGSMTKAQSISAIGRKGSFETEVWGEADVKWSYRRHEAKAKCEWQKSLQENSHEHKWRRKKCDKKLSVGHIWQTYTMMWRFLSVVDVMWEMIGILLNPTFFTHICDVPVAYSFRQCNIFQYF